MRDGAADFGAIFGVQKCRRITTGVKFFFLTFFSCWVGARPKKKKKVQERTKSDDGRSLNGRVKEQAIFVVCISVAQGDLNITIIFACVGFGRTQTKAGSECVDKPTSRRMMTTPAVVVVVAE